MKKIITNKYIMKKIIIIIAILVFGLGSCKKKEEPKPKQETNQVEKENIKKQIAELEAKKVSLQNEAHSLNSMGGAKSTYMIQRLYLIKQLIENLDEKINELFKKLVLLNS